MNTRDLAMLPAPCPLLRRPGQKPYCGRGGGRCGSPPPHGQRTLAGLQATKKAIHGCLHYLPVPHAPQHSQQEKHRIRLRQVAKQGLVQAAYLSRACPRRNKLVRSSHLCRVCMYGNICRFISVCNLQRYVRYFVSYHQVKLKLTHGSSLHHKYLRYCYRVSSAYRPIG